MVFCRETVSDEATVHTRMFAPLLGVPEDPATGSASGALGAYLVRHGAVSITPPTTRIVSEQGVEMGRPSTITIDVEHADGEISAVRVGGEVVNVLEGVVRL